MNESYAEAGVKRKGGSTSILIIAGSIVLAFLVMVFGSALLGPSALMFSMLIVAGGIFMVPRMNVEYEYVYCDGQLDFDKITGNSKRKTKLRIDFDKVDMVAPVHSHALDSYNNNSNMVVKDFSSKTAEAKVYAIIYHSDKQLEKILFEPSEKMLTCIKQKTPRKISEI